MILGRNLPLPSFDSKIHPVVDLESLPSRVAEKDEHNSDLSRLSDTGVSFCEEFIELIFLLNSYLATNLYASHY